MASAVQPMVSDTLITIKVSIEGTNRKFKLPLKDLNPPVFPNKLRAILGVPADQKLILERFSDSSASYITLDTNNSSAYKQLYRAAKAKLKLRIKATVIDESSSATAASHERSPEVSATPVPAAMNIQPVASPVSVATNIATGADRDAFFAHLATISRERKYPRKEQPIPAPSVVPTSWQVYCNKCDKPMNDVHYHCSVCDDGDYDLCEDCVTNGMVCRGDSHWLIKRCVKNGVVVNSTTQTLPSKQGSHEVEQRFNELVEKYRTSTKHATNEKPVTTEKPLIMEKEADMPGAFKVEIKPTSSITTSMRTCNACVSVLPETSLVTCDNCEDFDLCLPCHVANEHGHHPAHSFKTICEDTSLSAHAKSLCNPGRNVRHAAVCDGCEQSIFGVRHKCLSCPDWDYCSTCVKSARSSHRGHRFAPIYEPLTSYASPSEARHFGIYCDGPLCTKKGGSYITGVRYKCSICHDTDFCANCEAHPSNSHHQTHPMIKMKTAIRNVSITTLGESQPGRPLPPMGDQRPSNNSSLTQSTMAVRPSRVPSSANSPPPYSPAVSSSPQKSVATLDAHFVCDKIPDGTSFTPGGIFTQSWTLKNPGPQAWPLGCHIAHVGGEDMLAVTVESMLTRGESRTNRVIYPGESFEFNVLFRAPRGEGHYISYWRLRSSDAKPFGHKLWCDINVDIDVMKRALKNSALKNSAIKNSAIPVTVLQEKPTYMSPLHDYQMQMMLLEMQNKKRLMQARQEFAAAPSVPDVTGGIRARLRELHDDKLPSRAAVKESMLKAQTEARNRMAQGYGTRAMQIASILNTTSAAGSAPTTMAPAFAAVAPVAPVAMAPVIEPAAVNLVDIRTPAIVEAPVAIEQSEASSSMHASQMVFPTLEKESPTSSVLVESVPAGAIATAQESSKVVEETKVPVVEQEKTNTDAFEDLESLDLEETDDGFMTDEEYDILDASDEDFSKA